MATKADYNRRADLRRALRAQALVFGWQEIPALIAFRLPDGALIVIDTDGNRHTAGELAPVTPAELAPVEERPETKAAEQAKPAEQTKPKKPTAPTLPSVRDVQEETWDRFVTAVRDNPEATIPRIRATWASHVEAARKRTGKEPKDMQAQLDFVNAYEGTVEDLPTYS